MSHKLLRDSRLYQTLIRIDRDLAAKAREEGCPCGGKLHRADYPRKPRGGPAGLVGYDRRLSLCCEVDGCRKRRTPPSVRFLGRRVYLGVVVVLVSALEGAITPRRLALIREYLEVSVRTIRRWQVWWREVFPVTAFWKAAKGRLDREVPVATLPAALLARFAGRTGRDRLVACLNFLAPITTTSFG